MSRYTAKCTCDLTLDDGQDPEMFCKCATTEALCASLKTSPSQMNSSEMKLLLDRYLTQHSATAVDDESITFFENLRLSLPKLYLSIFDIADHDDHKLIMINGSNDRFLYSLAERFGFPRGFPVVWNMRTQELVSMSGFYPKFENDDEQTMSILDHCRFATRLEVTRKWSGYLSSCVLFQIDQTTYRVITSKKSADDKTSVYVQEARRIWDKILTPRAVNELYGIGIRSIWAETLMKKDQTHGNCVKENAVVITAVGREITSSSITPIQIGGEDLYELMKQVALEHHCIVPIHVPRQFIAQFIADVQRMRDSMTELSFQAILRNYGLNYKSRHYDLMGNRLEGLVFAFHYDQAGKLATDQLLASKSVPVAAPMAVPEITEQKEDEFKSSPRTFLKLEKFKFPGYTSVTMFLRSSSLRRDSPNALGFINEANEWNPLTNTVKAIERFVQRWVFQEESRGFWRGKLLALSRIYDLRALPEFLAIDKEENDEVPRPWIRAADYLDDDLKYDRIDISELTVEQLRKTITKSVDVYVALGMAGTGKTSACNAIVDCVSRDYPEFANKIVHVDGDDLGHYNPEVVSVLGAERNAATVSEVAAKIAQGFLVLVSSGGGALGTNVRDKGDKGHKESKGTKQKFIFDFTDQLEHILGHVRVNMVVLTPSDGWGTAKDSDRQNLDDLFKDSDLFKEVVANRVKRGVWSSSFATKPRESQFSFEKRTTDSLFGQIYPQLQNNLEIVHLALTESKYHMTFPRVKLPYTVMEAPSIEVMQKVLISLSKAHSLKRIHYQQMRDLILVQHHSIGTDSIQGLSKKTKVNIERKGDLRVYHETLRYGKETCAIAELVDIERARASFTCVNPRHVIGLSADKFDIVFSFITLDEFVNVDSPSSRHLSTHEKDAKKNGAYAKQFLQGNLVSTKEMLIIVQPLRPDMLSWVGRIVLG